MVSGVIFELYVPTIGVWKAGAVGALVGLAQVGIDLLFGKVGQSND